jgi:hypothetical protein
MNNLPTYLKESKFDQQKLKKLLTEGELDRSEDNFGVLNFNLNEETSESKLEEHLLLIPMEKLPIIPPQVETYAATDVIEYADDVEEIEEVLPEDDEELSSIEEDLDDAISNEQMLQAQIDELSSTLDEEMSKNVKFREDSAEMYLAAKDTIISQRITSGEGTSADDFQDVFPFLPKTSEEKEKSLDRIENFPFLGQ